MNEDVLYMICPHCGKGWFGKIKYKDDKYIIVEGLTNTDVAKELTCLNCGQKYHPLNTSIMMWDFVAKAVTTVKGS